MKMKQILASRKIVLAIILICMISILVPVAAAFLMSKDSLQNLDLTIRLKPEKIIRKKYLSKMMAVWTVM